MTPAAQRVVGVAVLLVTGMMSLPVAAFLLDGRSTENWIIPVQLLAMAATGAALTVALPGMAREGSSTGRRVRTGIWWGLLAAVAGVAVAWFLISGLRGA